MHAAAVLVFLAADSAADSLLPVAVCLLWLCSHLWSTTFARSGLPLTAPADELQRRRLLPDMSARDVCKRMLSNLCHLSMGFLQDRGAVYLRRMYLLLPLVQLAARFSSDAFLAWGRPLLAYQELLDFCSMTQLYRQLLDQAGHGEVSLGVNGCWPL